MDSLAARPLSPLARRIGVLCNAAIHPCPSRKDPRNPSDIAQTIRNWLAQADRDAGERPDGLPSDEREELYRLRRENKTLREEREILEKAAAWFAREIGLVPSKDSSS
jgi:hypothetical protein